MRALALLLAALTLTPALGLAVPQPAALPEPEPQPYGPCFDTPAVVDECGDTLTGDLSFPAGVGLLLHGFALNGQSGELHWAGELVCTEHSPSALCGDISGVGAGQGLLGGASSGQADLAVDFGAVQARVAGSCLPGSAIRLIGPDGSVACDAAPAAWSLAGNAGTSPATHFLGTTDAVPFEVRVGNARALRIVPGQSPSLLAGSHANFLAPDVSMGATIAGGGHPVLGANSVHDNFGTVAGGALNRAGLAGPLDSAYATVSGGWDNNAAGHSSTVGGGYHNFAIGGASVVGGGAGNIANQPISTVAGGDGNVANGIGSAIGGGEDNAAAGHYAVVAGGWGNTAPADGASVAGGQDNLATGDLAAVGGGEGNSAGGDHAVVAGGRLNTAPGLAAAVLGGEDNAAAGARAVVAGGRLNTAPGLAAAVLGGEDNAAGGDRAVVAGGQRNTAPGAGAGVLAGEENHAGGQAAVVAGGRANEATGPWAVVAGGWQNKARAENASVAGGFNNSAGLDSFVGGGVGNRALTSVEGNPTGGGFGVVGGGLTNRVLDPIGVVAGGWSNTAKGFAAFVGGGRGNLAGGTPDGYTAVAGGESNAATGHHAAVGGGQHNDATGPWAVVSGGSGNEAAGSSAMVPGGSANKALGHASLAAGAGARALHDNAFAWADGSVGTFDSTAKNQFNVLAVGDRDARTVEPAVRFVTSVDGAGAPVAGVVLYPGDSAWSALSDKASKRDVRPVDARAVAREVAALPLATWSYRAQDPGVRHMGPMAQDFHAAFGLGSDPARISTVDADGVALAAVQGLWLELQDRDARIAALEARLAALEGR